MKIFFNTIWVILFFYFPNYILAQNSQTENIKFNKNIHNFGYILANSGSRSCFFEFKNDTEKPILIYDVISSCSCSSSIWPKTPIMPGKSGKIEVIYLNNQGTLPFDKALTVYTSVSKKPIILRIKGLVYERDKDLKELFPIKIGSIGLKKNPINMEQINQGERKSILITLANLSNKEIDVDFKTLTPGLELISNQSSILPNEIADVSCRVDTKNNTFWGKTIFKAKIICNGIEQKEEIKIETMVLEDFSNLTKHQKDRGPMVIAEKNPYNFGVIKKGSKFEKTFILKNTGYSDLKIYKIDKEDNITVIAPASVKPGENFTVKVIINTLNSSGEVIYPITLVTNSPNKPLVELFLMGEIN